MGTWCGDVSASIAAAFSITAVTASDGGCSCTSASLIVVVVGGGDVAMVSGGVDPLGATHPEGPHEPLALDLR